MVCLHLGLSSQAVIGTVLRLSENSPRWWDFIHFRCTSCGLDCFRKRQLGWVINGAWIAWEPRDEAESKPISAWEPSDIGTAICDHPEMKTHKMTLVPNVDGGDTEPVQTVSSFCNNNDTKTSVQKTVDTHTQRIFFAYSACGMTTYRERQIYWFSYGPWVTKLRSEKWECLECFT